MNMKKSMIALAVAGAFVSSAAMAEVTAYGVAHVSIDRVNDGATTNGVTTNQLNSRQSRLGFKGAEDLGGGMSAIWQIERSIAMDDGSITAGSAGARNTFVGLKSDSMGTVLVGRNDTPYKTSTRNLDVFADTAADNRNVMGKSAAGTAYDTRVSNAIAYTSPNMSGLSIAAMSVFGSESANGTEKKGSLMSLAAMYSMDQIYATLAIQNAKAGDLFTGELEAGGTTLGTGSSVDDKLAATKVGVGFTTDQFAVNLVYENLKSTVASSGAETKNTNMYLGGKFNISSTDAVKLAYAKAGQSKTTTTLTDGTKQISLGYDHGMSKNTTVYALYTKLTNDASTQRDAFDTVGQGTVNDSDPSVISFGLKHVF